MKSLCAAAIAIALLWSFDVLAQETTNETTEPEVETVQEEAEPELPLLPRHRLLYTNLLAARLNPLGLEDRFNLGYVLRLYDSPGILWRDAHLGVFFSASVSPAHANVGGRITIKPLALLTLSASYYFTSWFGSFEFIQSYPSARSAHSDTDLDDGKEEGENYSTTGSELHLFAQVLAKVGPIVLRNQLTFIRSEQDIHDDDKLYYHSTLDAMLPNEGWVLNNDTDLVYLTDFGLVAGIRTSIVHAFYDDEHFLPGEDTDNPNTPIVRIGPLVAYLFDDDLSEAFNKPTLILVLNWHLEHRYRTGDDVHQAIPYVALAFRFEGDLWHSK